MSNSSTPNLQVLYDFGVEMRAYSFQNEEGLYDPAIFIGPLSRINIFVGATNSGKSRFLRALAKSKDFRFIPEEMFFQMTRLRAAASFLSNHDGSVQFDVFKEGTVINANMSMSYFSMPLWMRECFPGFRPDNEHHVVFDSQWFENAFKSLTKLMLERFVLGEGATSTSSLDVPNILEGIWLKNLIDGEEVSQKNAFRNSIKAFTNQEYVFPFKWQWHDVNEEWKKRFRIFWSTFDLIRESAAVPVDTPGQRIYIPTLRSAVSLRGKDGQRIDDDVFATTTKKNYALEDFNLEVFTGNRLYHTLKKHRNGTPEIVEGLRSFERFLSQNFYEGRAVEVVAVDEEYEAGQHISVRIENETARDLHNLGDGINTLIILLYQLFMAKPDSWIFIEEPELNLHPGLQRVFLETLLHNADLRERNLRIFFTTHSNHLLRMTLRDGSVASEGISVFAFQQRDTNKNRFLIRPLISEHHDALSLLGVQNASVLMAQCGVWVEGVTDRLYIRAFLKAYQESPEFVAAHKVKMREDTHFAFWEYAGSNLAHYLMEPDPQAKTSADEKEEYKQDEDEITREIQSSALCNRIFLLADQDKKKGAKHAHLNSIAEGRSNFVYAITTGLEIENMLSAVELRTCLSKLFGKAPNNEVSFKEKDYLQVGLGKFLSSKFPNECPKGLKAKQGETLATHYKLKLAREAIHHINWATMSDGAKELTERLYEFLLRHNQI